MVVSDDDCRGAVGKCIGEDFAWMNRSAVNQTHRDDADIQNLVGTIDGGTQKMFLLPVGKVPNVRQEIGRGLDLDALRFDSATREFNRRQNQSGLCITNT